MSYSNYQLNQKINNLQNQINGGATLLATNNTWTGTNTFDNNLRLNSTLTDTSGDVGTAGQVLSSTGTGTNWITQSSGSTYINYTSSATLPTTTNPTLLVLFSGTTAGQTLTIPTSAYSVGQVIQFKNRASVNVTISSGLSLMFLYASGTSTTVTSYSLAPNDTYNLYWIGFAYVQYTPSNTFSTLASPIYNSAIDTTAGTTALTIGSNVITGNIVIGNNTAFNGIINIGGSSVSPNLPNILIGAYNTTLYLVKGFVLSVDTSLGLGQYKAYLNVDDIRTDLYLGNNITTGSLRLGSSLTTGDIYLGEAQTAGGIVSIGSVNSETTINGVLIGQNGCIAGRTNYQTFGVDTTLSTNVNLDYLVVFTGPSTGRTITIPSTGYNIGQIIRIKNSANIDVFVTTGTVPTVLYSVTLTATTYTLRRRDTMNLIYTGVSWIQFTPSNKFTDLELTSSLTSASVLSPIINPLVDTLATVTALSIGSNVVNGNIVIGSALGVGDISIASAQAIGGTVTIGSANSETTINGTTKLIGPLNVNSSTGTTDQYLASQGVSTPIWKTLPVSSWIGTATSNLDMGIYNIITTGYLSLGAGSQILCQNNVIPSGSNNQYLSSQGLAGVVWKDIPASTWVSTATSNLNMDTFNIRCNTYRSQSATTQLTIGDNLTSTGSAFDVMLGIGTSITSTSAVGIAIGGANTNTRIYGPTVISGALTLGSSITTTGNINLNSTGLINLNSSSGTTDQYLASQGTSTPIWKTIPSSTWVGTATSNLDMGIYSISAPTINSISNSSTLSICSSQTTGIINIGTGGRTKSIGTNQGDINIGTGLNGPLSGSVAPTINIGNNTTAGNTTEISIGASATKTTINGPLTLTGATTSAGITASSGNIAVSSGNISASGTITSASGGITATTGNITASSGNIIASSGNISASGSVNGTTSVYTPLLTTIAATVLNIGTTNATSVNISSAGATTTINGPLTASDDITLGSSKFITTSHTGTMTLPTSSQVGYIQNVSYSAPTSPATGQIITIRSITLQQGVWIITGALSILNTQGVTSGFISFTDINIPTSRAIVTATDSIYGNTSFMGITINERVTPNLTVYVTTTTANTTYYFNLSMTYTGTPSYNSNYWKLYAIRIA
jgi:hypothetical protein